MKTIYKLLFLGVLLLYGRTSNAQFIEKCIFNDTAPEQGHVASTGVGQSFVSDCSTQLRSISMQARSASSTLQAELQFVMFCKGNLTTYEALWYKNSGFPAKYSSADFDNLTFDLTSANIQLEEGQSYWFMYYFVGIPNFWHTGNSNPDSKGIASSNGSLPFEMLNGYDFLFRVNVQAPPKPPVFVSDGSFSITENATGTAGDVNANNGDGGASDVGVTYAIAGGADAAFFNINSTTGEVSFKSSPDYETPLDANADNLYSLTVRATDTEGNTDQDITVAVLDEKPKTNSGRLWDIFQIEENITDLNLYVTDELGTWNENITYSISGGEDADKFQVNSNKGISFITPPDYENPTSKTGENYYYVKVTAKNPNNTSIEIDLTVVIANARPAFDDVLPVWIKINEHTSFIFDYNASVDGAGPDEGLVYSLLGPDADLFEVDEQTGVVTVKSVLDYEHPLGSFDSKGGYLAQIMATMTEPTTGYKTADALIAFYIGNVNEEPTDIAIDQLTVNEEVPIGTFIGNISTIDEDLYDTYTYEVLTQLPYNGNMYAPVSISEDQVYTAIPVDHEVLSSLDIEIKSTDDGGLSFTKTFTFTVNDVPEAPTDILIDNLAVDEEVPIGTFIGNISTVDQDANDTHTYEVLTLLPYDGNLYDPISISEGKIYTALPLDYETTTSMDIEIRSVDSKGLYVIKTFTFVINDLSIVNPEAESLDWNNPDSWENGQLPDENTDVSLPADFTVVIDEIQKVKNLHVNENTTIEIKEGGALAIYGEYTGTGKVAQAREITGTASGGYSIVGSPMAVTPDVSTLPVVIYEYNVHNGFVPKTSGSLQPGRGYFLRETLSTGNPLDLKLAGKPNTGNVTVAITAAGDTYNLLSNPYTAAISVVDFIDNNPTIDGTLYLWDDGGANSGGLRGGDYLAVNKLGVAGVFNSGGFSGGTGSGAFDMNIGSIQGFFVSALSESNVTFSQDMQVTTSASNAVFFRVANERNAALPQTVKLQLSNGDLSNVILVGLAEGATISFDRGFDSKKLVGNSEISFYTTRNNSKWSIEGVGSIEEGQEAIFNLSYDLTTGGAYEINMLETMNLAPGMQVLLYDREADKYYDLMASPKVSFDAVSGTDKSRFSVVFRQQASVLGESLSSDAFTLRGTTAGLNIHFPSETLEHVQIYDLAGHQVADQNLLFQGNEAYLDLNLQSHTVYVMIIRDQSIKFLIKE